MAMHSLLYLYFLFLLKKIYIRELWGYELQPTCYTVPQLIRGIAGGNRKLYKSLIPVLHQAISFQCVSSALESTGGLEKWCGTGSCQKNLIWISLNICVEFQGIYVLNSQVWGGIWNKFVWKRSDGWGRRKEYSTNMSTKRRQVVSTFKQTIRPDLLWNLIS